MFLHASIDREHWSLLTLLPAPDGWPCSPLCTTVSDRRTETRSGLSHSGTKTGQLPGGANARPRLRAFSLWESLCPSESDCPRDVAQGQLDVLTRPGVKGIQRDWEDLTSSQTFPRLFAPASRFSMISLHR